MAAYFGERKWNIEGKGQINIKKVTSHKQWYKLLKIALGVINTQLLIKPWD